MRLSYFFIFNILITYFSCQKKEDSQPEEVQVLSEVANVSYPLEGSNDLDILLNEIGDSRYVLLGEASHGTSEYYTWRAEISKRLIQEKGFTIIAVEGDWPDLYRFNQYIRGSSEHGSNAVEVLQKLDRWPTWMWANQEVADFGEWLQVHNHNQLTERQVGFYGLDVYSLWNSMEEVLNWLDKTDPTKAEVARAAYACLDPYKQDEWAYAEASSNNNADCADELALVLEMVRKQAADVGEQDEAAFIAIQNALTVVNAERYYVAAAKSNSTSWNIRDHHMVEIINNLIDYHGPEAKIIVWEHNTHVGDARATDMAQQGTVNVGQLVREQHHEEGVYIVGFGSYSGNVIAANRWEASMQEMRVPEARTGSWEALLHSIEPLDKIVLVNKLQENDFLKNALGHRAIGVVYNPGSEQGNYVPSVIPQRYDAFLYIDQTHALSPLSVVGNRKSERKFKKAKFKSKIKNLKN